MVFDLSELKSYGLIDSGVSNAISVATRTAKISYFGIQSKVRIFVGSAPGLNDKWDSGEVSTNMKSMYYGGGNNLQAGETYWVNIQTYSEQSGWGETQTREFTMPK